MFGSTILVQILVNTAAGAKVLSTPVLAAYAKGGISGAMTGVMAEGLIYIIVSIIIRFIEKKWIDKVLPPVVIGPMIMIIGSIKRSRFR